MKTLSKFLVGAPLSLAAVLAAGCPTPVAVTNDTGPIGNDAGMGNDTGRVRPDAATATLGTCAAPRMVMPALGVEMTVTGNTTGGPAGPLTITECGNTMATTMPPQEVIAVQIPGTGTAVLQFDLTEGTDAMFDTVVQVRSACTTDPADAAACFDDVSRDVLQSAGEIPVMGGDTVYLVVTGFEGGMGTMSSGAYSAKINVIPNTAPTLTAATAARIGTSRFYVSGTGMDAEMNATGYTLQFLNAMGAPISLDPMDATAVGPFNFPFDTAPTGTTFTDARSSLNNVAGLTAGQRAAIASAVSVRVIAVDEYGLMSAMRDVMITDLSDAAFGATCDATHICAIGNVCTAGTCQAPAAVTAACMTGTAVTLTAPTATAPTVSAQSVMLAAGAGAINGTCGLRTAGGGAERLYNVTVPAGNFDLIATTNVAATAMDVDTVVYIRPNCLDSATDSCNDDYDMAPDGDFRSTATRAVTAGTYTVVVDTYQPLMAATTAGLELRLRSVLPAGAACDPMGVNNRCATGACPATGMAVCPPAPAP